MVEVERHQRPADPVGERGSGDGVDQRRPHQIAGNCRDVEAEDFERRGVRQRPEDDDERQERHDRAHEAGADGQRALDEHPDVFGDALVRVVGGVAEQLHAVVGRLVQPAVQVLPRHPAPPADLQPLVQIELVDLQHGGAGREETPVDQLVDEDVPVPALQRVVEAVLPVGEQHRDADQAQFHRDDRGQQQASGPAVLGVEIRGGQPPDRGKRREDGGHGALRQFNRGATRRAPPRPTRSILQNVSSAKARRLRRLSCTGADVHPITVR